MINHKVVPIRDNPEDKLRLVACKVTYAVVKTPDNLMAYFVGSDAMYCNIHSKVGNGVLFRNPD